MGRRHAILNEFEGRSPSANTWGTLTSIILIGIGVVLALIAVFYICTVKF